MLKYVLLLCSLLVLSDYVCIIFSTLLLCPCWILYPWSIYLSVFVLVECWTCKWYFELSLLACMSGCSFLVWMIIVITISSDCQAMLYCHIPNCLITLCLIHMHFKISAYNDRFVLLFSRKLVSMVQELHNI